MSLTNPLPRVKRETIEIAKYDLITITFCANGKAIAVLEFDRLAAKTPQVVFTAKGSTTTCSAKSFL